MSAKFNKPTNCISQIHIVKKPSRGTTHLYRFQASKKTQKRTLYVTKVWYFMEIGLSSGLRHIELDERSGRMTTFGTPYGHYPWRWLRFGLKLSGVFVCRKWLSPLVGKKFKNTPRGMIFCSNPVNLLRYLVQMSVISNVVLCLQLSRTLQKLKHHTACNVNYSLWS